MIKKQNNYWSLKLGFSKVLQILVILLVSLFSLRTFLVSQKSPISKSVSAAEPDAFLTTWRVAGDEAGRTIIIPINTLLNQYAHLGPIVINFTIDWGDGSPVETFTNASLVGAPRISHTYTTPGDYQVKIRGSFPGWDMGTLSGDAKDNANKIISLDQWGTSKWRSMEHAFYYAENMIAKYTDQPDTSLVTNMHQAFAFARKFNGRINFDTRNATNMSSMFHEANAFDSPITFSDTSKVTNMSGMFLGAVNFNQPISFNTTNVTNMGSMFQRTTRFNQPLSLDTRNVTNMNAMFQQSGFNHPLNFNTAKVQNMSSMFMSAPKFNQPLNFDTRNVKNMSSMFFNSPQNSPLNFTDTSQVTNMSMMFHLSKFNQPLNFDTRSVTTMDSMFSNSAFNRPITFNGQSLVSSKKMFAGNQTFNSTVTLSNTTKLADVSGMFNGAIRYNQPITFATSAVTDVREMFKEATAFNQDLSSFDFNKVASGKLLDFASNSGLSTINNDKLITRWHQQLSGLINQQPLSTGLKFCKSQSGRASLIAKGWIFQDTRNCSTYIQAPVDVSLSATALNENNSGNTHLANITVQNHPDDNPDDVNTVTIACAVPASDDNAFAVDGNRLIFKPVANYEVKNSYNLCLRATDTTNLFVDKNFTITIRDINESPVIQPQTFSIAENSANGTEFGQIVATDPDNGQTLSYEIVSGNDLNIFEVTSDGKLRVQNSSNLDYEQVQQVVLLVKVKDSGAPEQSSQANITINITDINEAPFFTSSDIVSVDEDSVKIHTLTATDPEGQALTFSSDPLPSWITLMGNTLTLRPGQSQVGAHQITVKVTDTQNTVNQTININVNNVNDAPEITSTPELQATKFRPYSYIISATDEDGDPLTYSATRKPAWLTFESTTRELAGTPGNDEAGNSYEVILTVNDGTTSVDQTFHIQVNDMNYPPVINDQSFNLNENTANGTEAYQVVASDPDNNPLSYQIVSGNTLDIFEITSSGMLKIKDNTNLDYEAVKKIVLRIQANDNGEPNLSSNAQVAVNIQNVNEKPIFTSADQISLKHIETKTHTLTAIDPENDSLTFSVGSLPTWITFSNDRLTITPTAAQIGDHQITAEVRDDVNTSIQNIKIKVLPGNVAPDINSQIFVVDENSVNGTILADIVATDFNSDDILSYEIISGNDLNIFEVTNTGRLRVHDNTNLDYEKVQQVILVVKVSDDQTPSLSDQDNITINIADINEAPSFTSSDSVTLMHTESKIHTLMATDPENNSLTFLADTLPSWITFADDKLTITPSISQVGLHQIALKVTDGSNTVTQTMSINVLEENIAPVINDQTFTVAENSINGTELGQIIATDVNMHDQLSYEIISGNELDIFEIIDNGKLKIKNNSSLDYEKVKEVLLLVRVKDNGAPQLSSQANIRISITDIDDQAPVINLSNSGPFEIMLGEIFNAPSATCQDEQSNCTLTIQNNVNSNKVGTYYVVYTATDQAGNQTVAQVLVKVKGKTVTPQQPTKPTTPAVEEPKEELQEPIKKVEGSFTINGATYMELNLNDNYVEPGVTCAPNTTCTVEIVGKVDTSKAGTYTVTYKLVGGSKTLTRRVVVKAPVTQTVEPKVSLWGHILNFLKSYWYLLLIFVFLWWLLLLLLRRRKEEEEEKRKNNEGSYVYQAPAI